MTIAGLATVAYMASGFLAALHTSDVSPARNDIGAGSCVPTAIIADDSGGFPMDGKYDSTEVEIFGQTYNVRGEGDPDYLLELARFVDARMREVAAEVATVDPMKIAILAALNIADEFSRYRSQRQKSTGIWIEKTKEISERLDKVMS